MQEVPQLEPSTPPLNVTTEAGLGLMEHSHNLRKRTPQEAEGSNMGGGNGGSSMSTESTLSESLYSESMHSVITLEIRIIQDLLCGSRLLQA